MFFGMESDIITGSSRVDGTPDQIFFLLGAVFLGIIVGTAMSSKGAEKGTFFRIIIYIVSSVFVIKGILAWFLGVIIHDGKIPMPVLLLLTVLSFFLFTFLSYILFINKRKGFYKKNPFFKEIVQICKQNNILGIQCFNDRIRLHKSVDPYVFRTNNRIYTTFTNDISGYSNYIARFTIPQEFIQNDEDLFREIFYSEFNYPDMNTGQLDVFSKALCNALGNYSKLVRSVDAELRRSGSGSVQTGYFVTGKTAAATYDSYNDNTKEAEANLYYECYVYNTKYGEKLKKAVNEQVKLNNAQNTKNNNSWD